MFSEVDCAEQHGKEKEKIEELGNEELLKIYEKPYDRCMITSEIFCLLRIRTEKFSKSRKSIMIFVLQHPYYMSEVMA